MSRRMDYTPGTAQPYIPTDDDFSLNTPTSFRLPPPRVHSPVYSRDAGSLYEPSFTRRTAGASPVDIFHSPRHAGNVTSSPYTERSLTSMHNATGGPFAGSEEPFNERVSMRHPTLGRNPFTIGEESRTRMSSRRNQFDGDSFDTPLPTRSLTRPPPMRPSTRPPSAYGPMYSTARALEYGDGGSIPRLNRTYGPRSTRSLTEDADY